MSTTLWHKSQTINISVHILGIVTIKMTNPLSLFLLGVLISYAGCQQRLVLRSGGNPNAGKTNKPLPYNSSRGSVRRNYFFAEQAQPQPEDLFSSCFCMAPVSVHAGHFFGLHLPSLVAPHFSHLNTAILFSLIYVLILITGSCPKTSCTHTW
jgi:hypothetical protein